MLAFVLRRAVLGVLVLWGLTFISFCFLASQDVALKTSPVLPQYWTWFKGVFTGRTWDLLNLPVASVLNAGAGTTMLQAIGHTVVLLLFAFVLVLIFGVGLALVAAMRRGTVLDVALRSLSYLAWGVPAFLLALLVQKLLYNFGGDYGAGPFPIGGWPGSCPVGLGLNYGTLAHCPKAGTGVHYVTDVLRYTALPSATLAVGFIGLHGRYLRTSLLDTLESPFVVTARGKGLVERRVVLRHALRASLPTFISAVLSDFGAIFGAALAIDWIFELNGLGTVLKSDFPGNDAPFTQGISVQMVVFLSGVLVLLSSFLSELALLWLDPRRREAV